jgi:hypothetical protein
LGIAVLSCHQNAAIRVRVTGRSGNQNARKTRYQDAGEARDENAARDEDARVSASGFSIAYAPIVGLGLFGLSGNQDPVSSGDQDAVCGECANAEERCQCDRCDEVFDAFHFLLQFQVFIEVFRSVSGPA